jgi:hypothetical protein
MAFISRVIIAVGLAICFQGCIAKYWQKGQFRKKVISSYSQEPLLVNDFIVCNRVRKDGLFPDFRTVETNVDSILHIFQTSIENLGIQTTFEIEQNLCNEELINVPHLSARRVKTGDVRPSKPYASGQQIMVPVIFIDNAIFFTGSISSAGVTDDQGFLFIPFVSLIVFIFDGERLVYRHMVTHKAEAMRAPEYEDAFNLTPGGTVTQENWDELVRRTMRRYMKRVEK